MVANHCVHRIDHSAGFKQQTWTAVTLHSRWAISMPVWPISCRFRTRWIQYSNLVELVRATKNTHIHKHGKNKPMPGYQEILDQNVLYIIMKNCKTNSISIDTVKPCVCSNLLYEIYKQLQSENRCIIIKEKILQKQCNQKKDASK